MDAAMPNVRVFLDSRQGGARVERKEAPCFCFCPLLVHFRGN